MHNLVNADDFRWLARAATSSATRRKLARKLQPKAGRVTSAWTADQAGMVWPNELERVRAQRAAAITGDPNGGLEQWFLDRWFPDTNALRMVSIGCGNGWKELRWAQTGRFAKIETCDVAATLVESANALAAEHGVADILHAVVAKGERFKPSSPADIVFAASALHHISGLDRVIPAMGRWLSPHGRALLLEFVGPRRFQWTDEQLAPAQKALDAIPARLRVQRDGRLKTRVIRPSMLRMRVVDPSEAVESDAIVPLMERTFVIEHRVPLGGTLIDLVIGDLGHNFTDPGDREADEVLCALLERESMLIADGVLPSDQMLLVGRVREPT